MVIYYSQVGTAAVHGINSMKEVVISSTEKLGNGWQVISTVIKSLGTTQKRVEARTING